MCSPLFFILCALLVNPILFSYALPISESKLALSSIPKKASNGSLITLKPANGLLHSQKLTDEKLPVDADDSENSSLLTSIPTFAPPAAVKKREDDHNVNVNIPIPTFSFGIPSVKQIRQYVSDRLGKKQKRSPTAQNANPLPSASPDAVKPHKAPVSDSTVNFINDAAGDQGDGPDDVSEDSVDPENAIQNMAPTSSASPAPLQSDVGDQTSSANAKAHSLAHSLGTISHAQFEEEDSGKRRRKRSGQKNGRDARKRDDNGYREQKLEDYHVPTLWNGEVNVDDLNWWELQELGEWLDNYAWAVQHGMKPPPTNSSSPTSTPAFSPSNSSDSSTPTASTIATNLPSPPKSLAKALGLKAHSSLTNKTHRGFRRNDLISLNVKHEIEKRLQEMRSARPLQVRSAEDNTSKTKREEMDDPWLEPIDISDEAYDEFRKQHPTFFGDGWKKEKRAGNLNSDESSPGKP